MKYPLYLDKEEAKQLEYEVVSDELLIYFTRKLKSWAEDSQNLDQILLRKNRLINMSRIISGGDILVLTPDDMGNYRAQERIYHEDTFCLIFRELSTVEIVEFLFELIKEEYFEVDKVNEMLKRDGLSFRYCKVGHRKYDIEVFSIEEAESESEEQEHPNIRVLIKRMENALENEDYSAVIHSSASIFETLAKHIIDLPTIKNQTLKSFFERYREDSNLPDPFLDYISDIYDDRNSIPISGHGSTDLPSISEDQAIIITEMTKAFVRTEYKMRL